MSRHPGVPEQAEVTGRPGGRAMARPLVIAIDGPAGAGKSSVARTLAHRLGILHLDTGAMYRAATVAVIDSGIDRDDPRAVLREVAAHTIDFSPAGEVRLDGTVCPVERVRSRLVTGECYRVANHPGCRPLLVARQQSLIRERDVVIEGRDATTVICPDAQLKVFLDASPEERARRRLGEAPEGQPMASLEEVAAEIRLRDQRDSAREVGPLRVADDALHLISDGLSLNEVIATLLAHAVQRQPFLLERVVADQLTVGRSRQGGYVCVAPGGPGPWQLGLTNPSAGRTPGTVDSLCRNEGGRQAAVLCQGRAVLVLAGRGDRLHHLNALPMLPQTWYVIEPGAWHGVIQTPGTICAWAEAGEITEEHRALTEGQAGELKAFLGVYLPR